MMAPLLNAMKAQAMLSANSRATVRHGIVSSYDHGNYCAKVKLQPENVETGWLPVTSPWVGNGWGMFAPPTPGDLVEVQFQEGSIEAGFVCGRLYNDSDRPLDVPSGEFWLVHQSGSFLKFSNDGKVYMHAANGIVSDAPSWEHTGPMHVTGDVLITGKETVTGNIEGGADIKAAANVLDQGGAKSMAGMRSVYNSHNHGGAGPNAGM